jgi:LmbE family N-acetylglucosaminyl deacetylase
MPGLVLAGAHPDDELFAAGLLAALAERSVEVHLLCLTRGEGGTTGKPPVTTRENLGAFREAELHASAAVLGARSVEVLGYVDPIPEGGVTKAPDADPDHLAAQVAETLRRQGAEAVLTHGSNGDYGHPAHRLMHAAVRQAVGLLGDEAPVFYTFNAAAPEVDVWGGMNADDPADLVLDVTPWLATKVRAFEAHVSQRELWVKPGGAATVEEYARRHAFHETFRRHRGAGDPLRAWLERTP